MQGEETRQHTEPSGQHKDTGDNAHSYERERKRGSLPTDLDEGARRGDVYTLIHCRQNTRRTHTTILKEKKNTRKKTHNSLQTIKKTRPSILTALHEDLRRTN